jgi:hypothetical protein
MRACDRDLIRGSHWQIRFAASKRGYEGAYTMILISRDGEADRISVRLIDINGDPRYYFINDPDIGQLVLEMVRHIILEAGVHDKTSQSR